jgi:hypothetical protein
MMNVDAAFDRIGSALRQRGYSEGKDERPPSPGADRSSVYNSQDMSVRVSWKESARLLTLEVDADGEWVEFARRAFGPKGLEDTAVEALVRAVRNEVAETSTDAD